MSVPSIYKTAEKTKNRKGQIEFRFCMGNFFREASLIRHILSSGGPLSIKKNQGNFT